MENLIDLTKMENLIDLLKMENLIDLMKMDVEKIHVVISIEYIVNLEKMENGTRTKMEIVEFPTRK